MEGRQKQPIRSRALMTELGRYQHDLKEASHILKPQETTNYIESSNDGSDNGQDCTSSSTHDSSEYAEMPARKRSRITPLDTQSTGGSKPHRSLPRMATNARSSHSRLQRARNGLRNG